MLVFHREHRAGGVDQLAPWSHAARSLLQQLQLQLGQAILDVARKQAPGNLGVATHGTRARTGGIQKDRIEQGTCIRNIEVRERRIEVAAITRRKFNTLSKTGLLQALTIDVAFGCRKIYGNMAPAQTASVRATCHHIRLGTASGTNLQT